MGELGHRVVLLVEQIIQLNAKLKPFGEVVVRQKVGDRVARCNTGAEIVDAVGLVCAVLVPAGVGTRYGHFARCEMGSGIYRTL